MATVTETMLRFPSQAAIVTYLEKHPSTKNLYPFLTEKKIIEVVAKFFADQEKTPMGIFVGVGFQLLDLNKTLKIQDATILMIKKHLTEALTDCAARKPISAEIKSSL